ncbi:lasso peptide biosynthesis B2 protein [Roseofilum capinflatum]|uniref:Lasso peptide biosynthesis B2 protein n=1 Tax=Roseofilum capinflatum BLCC-M114 TaxID=3022440 RepID=A0ABT7B4B7_9CYAN|nr:lasso peptide biosynthesis B2 protein [Roseofilum capinflatum]MDJ1173966.1 lasso peptide biosynthesis B2 protein [Roseofilum capinflatum BLCC-M114]
MKNWFALLQNKAALFWQQPSHRKMAFLEAFLWLGLARGCVLLFPFRWIAPYLGGLNQETSEDGIQPAEQAVVEQIAWAIATSSRYTPWRSNCLAQAIAAKIMLRRRKIASTLYLGLKKNADKLEAHAWLRVGQEIITGGAIESQFKVISFFGS